jgi:DNA polymerase-3 subunit gamma/tau
LKTLEEPPAHVKFIFATTEPQKVLPTIVSRCQRFDLHRIPANLIAQHLQFIAGKEKIALEPAAGHAIARGAEGGLRDAESMLDQLVGFCGEIVSESDVLSVFGFTRQQTVADFTGRILRGETADAVQLLHDQCEAGKDMMRLMADLISYLRDLLVFKAKPDALNEDVDLDLQKSLAAQAELITTDRLLDLIDQFAQAEGRMKWAPNKKLHFEVAVIKAIQSLGQATLDEVIEKLGELRDGKDVLRKEPGAVAAGSPRDESVRLADTAASTAPRVAETGLTPAPDPGELWQKIVTKIPQKGFLRTLSESVSVIGVDGRNFLLGYPLDQKSAIETLASANNRRQLETLLKEASGRDWTIKFIEKEGLGIKPLSRAPSKGNKVTAESFKDDPLIQEALEIFKGEIRT